MRYQAESHRRLYSFPIPEDEFIAVMEYESLNSMNIYGPNYITLCSFLEKLSNFYTVEYNGHFGSNVHMIVDSNFGEQSWDYLLSVADGVISDFMDDARRVQKYFPNFTHGIKIPELKTPYTLLYSDADFVIFRTDAFGQIFIGHENGTTILSVPDNTEEVIEIIQQDMQERRYIEEEDRYLPTTPSRDLDEVRSWVSKFISLPSPEISKIVSAGDLQTLDVANHKLHTDLPKDGRPIWVSDDFIFCDNGKTGLSVTFTYEDSNGTSWFIDGAKDQMIELINMAKTNAEAKMALERHIIQRFDINTTPSLSPGM